MSMLAAGLTLAGGSPPLARSSSAMAASLGIDGVESGATELAVATTIPVLSTGMRSVRLGNRELVVSQTFGFIAFLSALFPLANLLTGEAVLPSPDGSNI
jgi:cation:H+ antiporter